MPAGALLALPLPKMSLSPKLDTAPPLNISHPLVLPVTVDRVTRTLAPEPLASNPSPRLFVIVEFRTITLTGVPPFEMAAIPENELFALTLSLIVMLMVWVEVWTASPSLNIYYFHCFRYGRGREPRW